MRASREDKPRKLRWTDGARGSTLLPALRRALQIAGLGLSAMVSACAASAPEHPTWDDDVRPLLVARCIRCHGDPRQIDPLSAKTNADKLNKAPTANFDYVYFGDLDDTAKGYLKVAPNYVRGASGLSRMPPLPAAALEDWELQVLVNFASDLKKM